MKNSIFNAVCKTRYLALLVVLIFTCGNVWGETYNLYSGTITEGDYIIVYSGKAMKNSITSSRWDYESVTVSNNKITNPTNEAKIVWHIAASGDYWTIYSTEASKYAIGTGTKNQGGMSASPTSNGEKWTVTGTSTYEFVNKRNADASVNKNLRGNGTYGFACYATSTGGALSLYKKAASCTPLLMSTVTATAGNAQISLSWPSVASASSYTVTCKVKSSGSPAGTVGGVSGSGTKTCTITGLSNGTEYTWSVMPVGTGSYCADNTPATGDATPNVSRTITYFDKDGSHTTSLTDGTNIATALSALYVGNPVSCDPTNYEYFVGWKVGEISGTASSVTLLDNEVVNASSPSNNYYAVWSDTDPSSGGWEQVTSLTIGDEVVFVYNGTAKYEMTGVASNLGTATYIATIPDDIAGTFTMTIEKGYNNTGYSFKNGTKYIRHNADKKIELSTTKDALSSWTPSGSSGNFKLNNNSNTSYNLQFNSGSPRWTDYSSNQSAFQIYKRASGGTVNYITTCCSQLGTINGSNCRT